MDAASDVSIGSPTFCKLKPPKSKSPCNDACGNSFKYLASAVA